MSFANPKGIASFSPRLARQRLPWVRVWNRKQRQRRCGLQPNVAATPLRWVAPIKRIEQPQRGCGSKPKVGAHAPTLGERSKTGTTATRLWPTSHATDGTNGRNRVAVGNVCWTVTQGSAFRATLGFGSESRWDSLNAQFKN